LSVIDGSLAAQCIFTFSKINSKVSKIGSMKEFEMNNSD
jgi:hypothetical protein